MGNGSCSPPIVAGYCASSVSLTPYAVTVRLDFDTTTRTARRAGPRSTAGTVITSPGLCRSFPGLSSASNRGERKPLGQFLRRRFIPHPFHARLLLNVLRNRHERTLQISGGDGVRREQRPLVGVQLAPHLRADDAVGFQVMRLLISFDGD